MLFQTANCKSLVLCVYAFFTISFKILVYVQTHYLTQVSCRNELLARVFQLTIIPPIW